MPVPIRWGICGTGKIAHDFCVCLNSQPEEHKIAAVAARESKGKAEDFAKSFGIPKSYGSYQELAADKDIDIVYIATIHLVHEMTSLMLIDAGKAVLCEKPMTLSMEGSQRVLQAAKDKGVLFVEGFLERFFPAYAFIREQLGSGVIGEVKSMQATICLPLMDVPRVTDIRLGGGALFDIGCHAIQAANFVFGDARLDSVSCEGVFNAGTEGGGGGVDTGGVIALRYAGGRLATLTYSIETPGGNNGLIIRGTQGTIKVPTFFWLPDKVVVNGQATGFPLPKVQQPLNFERYEGMIHEAHGVGEAFVKGLTECPEMTHADSTAIMTIMQKALERLRIQPFDG